MAGVIVALEDEGALLCGASYPPNEVFRSRLRKLVDEPRPSNVGGGSLAANNTVSKCQYQIRVTQRLTWEDIDPPSGARSFPWRKCLTCEPKG